MTKKKRGLGSLGVDVLLSAVQTQSAPGPTENPLRSLPIEMIRQSPYQPRQVMRPAALAALADSIRKQGLVQPIVVRKTNNDYELIAGERRWRAAQLAGLQEIPATVQVVTDQQAAAMALVENLQREDLAPLEEAQAFSNLIEKFALTHQEISEIVGRSRAAVSNSLRLLTLADPVKDMLNQNQIEMGHARALLALPPAEQSNAAHTVVRRKLSVRGAELLAKQLQQKEAEPAQAKSHPDPDIVHMEQKLSAQLGAATAIQHHQNGSGWVKIRYTTLNEFEGIVEKVLGDKK